MTVLLIAFALWTFDAVAGEAAQAYLRAANVLYDKLEYEKALRGSGIQLAAA